MVFMVTDETRETWVVKRGQLLDCLYAWRGRYQYPSREIDHLDAVAEFRSVLSCPACDMGLVSAREKGHARREFFWSGQTDGRRARICTRRFRGQKVSFL